LFVRREIKNEYSEIEERKIKSAHYADCSYHVWMRYHKHGYSSAFIDVWLNVAPVAPVVSSPVSVAAVSYVTLISTIGRVELVSIGSNLIILPFEETM
jgi:hypothetical protein